jgi:DNA-binding winged helix-turn-helix (wHTH) protein/tetratricopeptide (TPR) repeat protein
MAEQGGERGAAALSQRVILARAPVARIGPLTITPALRQILHADGREEIVEPKVMEVLVALLRADGGILTRDELCEAVWDGRIVGDDAVNRVMARLRRIATGIGSDGFTVETITKVGYRLTVLDRRPAIGTPTVPAVPIMPVRRRAWLAGLVIAPVVALLLGLILWFGPFHRDIDTPQVRLARFDSLAATSPLQPTAMRAELLAAFGTDSSLGIITDDKPAGRGRRVYVLGGTVGGDARAVQMVMVLTDEASGTQIWTGKIERPATDLAVAARLGAAVASQIVRCTLSGIAEQKKQVSLRAVQLYAAYCSELWADDSNMDRVADLARRVTDADPDFARGWSGLALVESLLLRDRTRPDWAAMHAEATAAAARAETLDPRNGETFAARALLLPITDFVGREAMHRHSVEVEPSDCGCEHQYYAVFLGGSGQLDKAAFEAKRGHDMEPLALVSAQRRADMLYNEGRRDEADRVFGQMKTLWPDAPLLADLDLRAALIMHDWDRGLARAARMPADTGGDAALLFHALKAGSPAAALARFRTLAADPATDSRFVADALGALGDDAGALAAAERLIDRRGNNALLIFFDPTLAAARMTPNFTAVAQRIGLLGYWRTRHIRPDFCRASPAPPVCPGL